MFAASTADWLMFAGMAGALGALATSGYFFILREPGGPEPEAESLSGHPADDLPEAA